MARGCLLHRVWFGPQFTRFKAMKAGWEHFPTVHLSPVWIGIPRCQCTLLGLQTTLSGSHLLYDFYEKIACEILLIAQYNQRCHSVKVTSEAPSGESVSRNGLRISNPQCVLQFLSILTCLCPGGRLLSHKFTIPFCMEDGLRLCSVSAAVDLVSCCNLFVVVERVKNSVPFCTLGGRNFIAGRSHSLNMPVIKNK